MAVEAPATVIVALRPEHWPAVARIYAEGIATGDATFETEAPAWGAWDAGHLGEHRFVALREGEVVGWVAARAVSDRCAYAGVVEHSVYVADTVRGQGVGQALLSALIASTEAAGIWTIQTGIFPENGASLRLHERAGFEVVGRRRRIGKRAGVWRDVIAIERRSPVVN
jgi:phosphinothricin acetyltransferase